MKVYLFQQRFAALVKSGAKRQTIRSKRKRPTKVGDVLSLREWKGKPYRSSQVILANVLCTETHSFRISANKITDGDVGFSVMLDDMPLCYQDQRLVAQADGFKDDVDMLNWFRCVHGIDKKPFEGELVRW